MQLVPHFDFAMSNKNVRSIYPIFISPNSTHHTYLRTFTETSVLNISFRFYQLHSFAIVHVYVLNQKLIKWKLRNPFVMEKDISYEANVVSEFPTISILWKSFGLWLLYCSIVHHKMSNLIRHNIRWGTLYIHSSFQSLFY